MVALLSLMKRDAVDRVADALLAVRQAGIGQQAGAMARARHRGTRAPSPRRRRHSARCARRAAPARRPGPRSGRRHRAGHVARMRHPAARCPFAACLARNRDHPRRARAQPRGHRARVRRRRSRPPPDRRGSAGRRSPAWRHGVARHVAVAVEVVGAEIEHRRGIEADGGESLQHVGRHFQHVDAVIAAAAASASAAGAEIAARRHRRARRRPGCAPAARWWWTCRWCR